MLQIRLLVLILMTAGTDVLRHVADQTAGTDADVLRHVADQTAGLMYCCRSVLMY